MFEPVAQNLGLPLNSSVFHFCMVLNISIHLRITVRTRRLFRYRVLKFFKLFLLSASERIRLLAELS